MTNAAGRSIGISTLEAEELGYLKGQVRQRRVARSMSERCRIIPRCADSDSDVCHGIRATQLVADVRKRTIASLDRYLKVW